MRRFSVLFFLCALSPVSSIAAQEKSAETGQLTPGRKIEREIAGGQKQSFLVTLKQGQFLSIVVNSHEIDVAVTLYDSDGKKTLIVDLLKYPGPEPFSFEAEKAGKYKLEIHAVAAPLLRGRYEFTTDLKPQAGESDKQRLTAERLLIEANDQEREGSTESLQKSLDLRAKALALWRKLGDRYWEAYSLHCTGRAGSTLKENEEALTAYGQALPIRKSIGDRFGEADTLNGLGTVYFSLGEEQKALDFYNRSLALYQALGDKGGQAGTLFHLGAVISQGEEGKALEFYNQALMLYRAVGDKSGEADVLFNLGYAYFSLRENQRALEFYKQALSLRRAVGDKSGEAGTLLNLGPLYSALGENQKALDVLHQALTLARVSGDKLGESAALMNLGVIYHDLGDNQKALDLYMQALPIDRDIGDKAGESRTLLNLGNVYSELGEMQKAEDVFNQALSLKRAVGDKSGEATTLNNLGLVSSGLGKMQKALEYYTQALVLNRMLGNKAGEALTLGNLGALYRELGENKLALDFFSQSLSLERAFGEKQAEAHTLSNIGDVHFDLGETKRAMEFYEQALKLERALGDRSGEAGTLNNLGIICLEWDEKKMALNFFNEALSLRRAVGDKTGEAHTLVNIGFLYSELGENERALEFYNQALPLTRTVGDQSGEALTFVHYMLLWSKLGKRSLAIFYGKYAINGFQALRRDIQGFQKDIQQSYLRSVETWYRELADLLISEGRLPEAQQVLGLLKAEEYFEFVRRQGNEGSTLKGRTELTPEEAAVEKRYSEIADRVTAIGVEYGTLRDRRTRTAEQEIQLSKLEKDLVVANQVFQKFLNEIEKAFASSTAGTEKAFQLRESQGLMETLRELGSGSVALYTLVGEDKYRVILITPHVQKAYEYSIKGADLNRKVLAFRETLQNPRLDPRPLAQELYKILIGPDLARDLAQAKAQTLMWSLDGVLRYLPFAALHDGSEYLVEHYRNVVFTPASRDRLKDPVSAKWRALGLGVSKAQPGFDALPGVPKELRGIIRDEGMAQGATGLAIRGQGVLAGRVMLDEQFTSNAMQAALRQRYSLVHIASHFQFHPGNETDSFLLLGDGSHLTLAQIKSLPNVFIGVDLLTLSACDTATGGAGASGKEVEGFGVLAQRQGAKAVLATLWPVADESTQLLMREFYRLHDANPRWTKAEALWQAQLTLLHGHNKDRTATITRRSPETTEDSTPRSGLAFKADPNIKYGHPYYWAPFILIGNWR